MSKYNTWKKTTSDHFSLDDLEFVTELKAEAVSGGGLGGFWGIDAYGRYVYLTPDYGSVPLAGYPTGPIDPQGWMLNQEAQNLYSGLQGIFTHLPSM